MSTIGTDIYSMAVVTAIEYLKVHTCYSFFRLIRAILRFGAFQKQAISSLHQNAWICCSNSYSDSIRRSF